MTLAALRDDALSSTTDGFELRLGLPWIRSLPLASLDGIEVIVDGERVEQVDVALGDRLVGSRRPRARARVVVPAGSRRPARATDAARRRPRRRRLVPPRDPLPAGGAGGPARPAVPHRPFARARCPGIRPLRLSRCRLTGKDPP